MSLSTAVITEVGGATSHAAVVSRELGVPCVTGCGDGTVTGLAGRIVTVDGATGEVYEGALPLERHDEETDEHLLALFEWAKKLTPIPVLRTVEAVDRVVDLEQAEADSLEGTFAVSSEHFSEPATARNAVARAVEVGASAIVANGSRLPILLECLAHGARKQVN